MMFAAASYVILALVLDDLAHRTLYPLIGYGYPLAGWRRQTVRALSPFVLLAVGLSRAPTAILLLLVLISRK